MTEYSKFTVAQLKEILTQRSLPLDGLKNDLVQRLLKNDEETTIKKEEELTKDEQPIVEEKKEEEEQKENDTETTTGSATVEPTASENTKQEKTSNPEPKKQLTAEEITKMALELLTTKLHRATKFGGNEDELDSIKRLMNRVEKFGLDLQNPLAVELGLVKPVEKKKAVESNKKIGKKTAGNNNKFRQNNAHRFRGNDRRGSNSSRNNRFNRRNW
ncbi:hypothetical protein KAFR_0L00920 [Kazachstania africana CBS 2517]|uniref:SAP domain-containing protein n=1 Tax=Kazachstania africana (strain ATCC 22294 / BCRC 22015 / CBS 2517 / CECT 1963 / NBRC 1671 / NRRL Y-8276) TaxID=1071382 RepID=H2B250_KAZAF|nr:hypothetical protein KAFR_0L00920 [Kazachstania africana CBS 2517]CCF60700.1 hypothetical protein KAFR_0L00920 [Kazachstania africana CBS 2517]